MSIILKRRVVSQITEYLEPKEIFCLITQREWEYTKPYQERCATRDRAVLSAAFCTGGRISAVVGGNRYRVMEVNGERKPVRIGKYEGLKWENLSFRKQGYILIEGMSVVKRSRKVLQKYGAQAGVRDDFVIPLARGLFENPYWDQLVPFAWLIMEHLKIYAPNDGKGRIFNCQRHRAWRVIRYVSGHYPNWFRAQAEHFYGHYLHRDSVKLAKFLKIMNPAQVGHYIGYSWKDQLKGKMGMDFDWIDRATDRIKIRINKFKVNKL